MRVARKAGAAASAVALLAPIQDYRIATAKTAVVQPDEAVPEHSGLARLLQSTDANLPPMTDAAALDKLPADEGLLAAVKDPAIRETLIAADREFRDQIGFPSDERYVAGLYDDINSTIGTRIYGALFTRAEADEVVARNNTEPVVIRIAGDLARSDISSFGGHYLDTSTGRAVLVVKEGSERALERARTEVEASRGETDRIDVRTARYSYAQLLRAQQVAAEAAETANLAGSIAVVWVDIPANQVVVDFDDTKVSPTQLGEKVKALQLPQWDGLYRFGRKARQGDASLVDDTNAPPFAGGHGYRRQIDNRACTNGFMIKYFGMPAGDGYMLSAAHCTAGVPFSGTDAKLKHGYNSNQKLFGVHYADQTGYGTDLTIIKMIDSSEVTPKVILGTGSTYETIKGQETVPSVNYSRCRVGARSDVFYEGYRCGLVKSNDASTFPASNSSALAGLDWVQVPTRHGDSGGPLVNPFACTTGSGYCALASGVLNSNNCYADEATCTVTPGTDSFYSSVWYLSGWYVATG